VVSYQFIRRKRIRLFVSKRDGSRERQTEREKDREHGFNTTRHDNTIFRNSFTKLRNKIIRKKSLSADFLEDMIDNEPALSSDSRKIDVNASALFFDLSNK
jgi:hypothetical protein